MQSQPGRVRLLRFKICNGITGLRAAGTVYIYVHTNADVRITSRVAKRKKKRKAPRGFLQIISPVGQSFLDCRFWNI